VIDADDPAYRAYRDLVDAGWDPHRVDRSEDRVQIARFDGAGFDAVRTLLARVASVERALVPATSRLAATRDGADAMALSAAAAAAATRLDAVVTYWDRVVDPEEHARGNDPTGLDAGRWLEASPVLDRLDDAASAHAAGSDPDLVSALADAAHVTETLLARGLYDLIGVVAAGEADTPGLPGLATSVDRGRETLRAVTLRVAGTGSDPTGDPEETLRSALPDVPGVAVGDVAAETAEQYRASLRAQDDEESATR